MSEKMKTTNDATALWEALAKFQQEVPAISKESSAGAGKFRYKYGSLPHIIEQIKPHLKSAGLCFAQPIVCREGIEYIDTLLIHAKSGNTLSSEIELPKVSFQGMNEVQSKGAIITYLRRYSLMSILGLVTDDDDTDAQGTTEPSKTGNTASNSKADSEEGKPWLNPKAGGKPNPTWTQAVKFLADGGKLADIKKKYRIGKANEELLKNEALTFDDLPFDREQAEIDSTTSDPDQQPNLDFENQ